MRRRVERVRIVAGVVCAATLGTVPLAAQDADPWEGLLGPRPGLLKRLVKYLA